MTTGMLLGKFLPPHLGHVYLGEFAGCYVDHLTIVVGSLTREPIPGELRFRWMRELFPANHVVHLTDDLPLQPRPFDALAKNSGVAADDLITTGRTMQRRGQIRRFGAVVHSRKPGFSASAMGVWAVPEAQVDEIGARLSQNRAVSHCYLRPIYEDWPYNIYTIVHGRSVDECESIINDLAADTGLQKKEALYPTKEYKKARITLFSTEADEWETAHGAKHAASAAS